MKPIENCPMSRLMPKILTKVLKYIRYIQTLNLWRGKWIQHTICWDIFNEHFISTDLVEKEWESILSQSW